MVAYRVCSLPLLYRWQPKKVFRMVYNGGKQLKLTANLKIAHMAEGVMMATGHIIGKDLKIGVDAKKGVTVQADLLDNLHPTAKMEMLVSTSGFIPTGAVVDGKPVFANIQIGVKKS